MHNFTKPILMFDMDGTLLDLAFDDLIWNHKLPERHAQTHGYPLQQSYDILHTFYQQHKHTLSWYSSNHWTSKVGVDVLKLQYDYQHKIAVRNGCFELLESLILQGYRCWLVTNADIASLNLKLENIDLRPYFEVIISSETIGHAKEFVDFWRVLQEKYPFDPSSVVLIDDTAPVLQGATKFGIKHLVTIKQPSSLTAVRHLQELHYPAINDLTELLTMLTQFNLKEIDDKTA